jgi:hypothetical protein
MAWYPEIPALEEWRRVYRAAARANGAEPDAGRRMRAWAEAAGLAGARFTASVWNYADHDSCRWWGNSQAERCCGPTFAKQAAEQGVAEGELRELAAAWHAWGESPGAWFGIVHGELLVQLPRYGGRDDGA